MSRLPSSLRRTLAYALLMSPTLTPRSVLGDNFTWEPNPFNSSWNLAANWAGTANQLPDDNTDSATVNASSLIAQLMSNRTIGALTIRNGGDVATGNGTSNFSLTVQDSLSQTGVTLIENVGSSLTVWNSPSVNDFDTDDLIINSGSDLTLQTGAKVQVDRFADLNSGGEIRGAGTLEIAGGQTFHNDGVIRADLGGTLAIQATGGASLDLDGSAGNGALIASTNSTLEIHGSVHLPFNGTVQIGQGGEVQFNQFFQLSNSPGSVINFNGLAGEATLSGTNLSAVGVVNVNSGVAVFAGPMWFHSLSTLDLDEGTTVRFDDGALISNPESIQNVFDTTLIVNSVVQIGEGSGYFDWDGVTNGSIYKGHTIVNPGGELRVDVAGVDSFGIEERYSGAITVNSGTIDVQNADGQWAFQGHLVMNNVSGTPATISGAEVLVAGLVEVKGTGSSIFEAPSVFQANSDIDVAAGASLSVGGNAPGTSTEIAGADWIGAGSVNLNASQVTVSAATTVNMPSGTFDLDGDFVGGQQITINAPLVLNVAAIDDDLNNEINDDLRLNSDGTLEVHFTNPNQSYAVDAPLDLNGPAGVSIQDHFAGADVEFKGATHVTGNSSATARVELSGSMQIDNNSSFAFRGGTMEAPSVVRTGATFTGAGELRVSSIGQGHLALEQDAHVGVELVNRGRLEVGVPSEEPIATATVASFTQPKFSTGTYEVNIDGLTAGTEYDQLLVTGAASLGGTLEIVLNQNGGSYVDPILPGTVDEFNLILAGIVTNDAFEMLIYDGDHLGLSFAGTRQDRFYAGDGLFRVLDYDLFEVELLNYKALPGDANGDGFVDGSDFGIWNANKFTAGTSWTTGDFNGDGVTDGSDFGIWNSNKFTQINLARTGGMPVQTVPEPTGFLWSVAGAILLVLQRKLQRK